MEEVVIADKNSNKKNVQMNPNPQSLLIADRNSKESLTQSLLNIPKDLQRSFIYLTYCMTIT